MQSQHTLRRNGKTIKMNEFSQYIKLIGKGKNAGKYLTMEQAYSAFYLLLKGQAEPEQIGAFLMFSILLFFIGILGEYIGQIYTQLLNRPLVFEKERINFEE